MLVYRMVNFVYRIFFCHTPYHHYSNHVLPFNINSMCDVFNNNCNKSLCYSHNSYIVYYTTTPTSGKQYLITITCT